MSIVTSTTAPWWACRHVGAWLAPAATAGLNALRASAQTKTRARSFTILPPRAAQAAAASLRRGRLPAAPLIERVVHRRLRRELFVIARAVEMRETVGDRLEPGGLWRQRDV